MPIFASLEWTKEYKKLWDADKETIRLLKGFDTTWIIKVSDKPEIKPVWSKVENGQMTDIRNAMPNEETEFVFEAPVAVWRAIYSGELEPTKAVMEGKLKLKGSPNKMMKYMRGWLKTLEIQKKVPTEW
jgi:putative sterol carrier protein